jgi:hypothetical protein
MRLRDAIELIAKSGVAALGPTTWADLECGTGTFTLALADQLAPGQRYPRDGPRRLGAPQDPVGAQRRAHYDAPRRFHEPDMAIRNRQDVARGHFRAALARVRNPMEQRFLQQRLDSCT